MAVKIRAQTPKPTIMAMIPIIQPCVVVIAASIYVSSLIFFFCLFK